MHIVSVYLHEFPCAMQAFLMSEIPVKKGYKQYNNGKIKMILIICFHSLLHNGNKNLLEFHYSDVVYEYDYLNLICN